MADPVIETPSELLNAARGLLELGESGSSGLCARASALLGRQALERLLAELWRLEAPGTEEASMRAQLICLPRYLEPRLAGRVAYAWGALSNACHQHAYELAPTLPELRGWLAVVEELDALPERSGPGLYSAHRVTAGSSRAARRAGNQQVSTATPPSSKNTTR